MFRIVLPSIASAGRQSRRAVTWISASSYRVRGTVADVGAVTATDARVAVEIVVAVDIDVIAAAPAAAPAPTTAPERPHHYANAK